MTTLERIRYAARIIRKQRALIASQQHQIEHLHLEHAREMQAMACAWLISIERPEVDLRDDLATLESDMANTVARLEEHIL